MDLANATAIISSRKHILTDGAYNLRVTNVHPFEGRFIVNFAAMTNYQLQEALTAMQDGDVQAAVNKSLSASLRPTDYIPTKGEVVKVLVDTVTTKNGVTGQFVTSVSEVKASVAGSIDFAALLKSKNPFETLVEEPVEA